MVTGKLPRVVDAAAMRDHADFFTHGFAVIFHADRFDFRVKPVLQAFFMGGDTCRAGVFVAFQGLNTAKREHETARGVDKIRARAKGPGDFGWRDEFP